MGGACCPAIAEELEEEVGDKVPEVASNLRASNEEAPQEDQEDRVERPADVTQAVTKQTKTEKPSTNKILAANPSCVDTHKIILKNVKQGLLQKLTNQLKKKKDKDLYQSFLKG